MFRVDQPIRSCKEDELGRESFAKELAKAILNYESEDSIVLGLFGPWGSGKTSILNCVREYIDEASQSLPKNKKPVLIVFNPWTYSDQNQLIAQFFKQISAVLKKSSFIENNAEIGKILEYFSLIFQPAVQVAAAEPTAAFVAVMIRVVGEITKMLDREQKSKLMDPEVLKEKLDKLLEKLQNKIIVVIDDVDRLNSSEIRQIFQLVKKLADFKNTVYLLAFDKGVVLDALKEIQGKYGEQYFEKIVTVPFDIPNPGWLEIRNLLEHGLQEITGTKEPIPILDYHENTFVSLFRNLRHVNRYLNSFRFAWGLIKDDIDLKDLMIITAIQVRCPRVYDAVRDSKDLFTMGYSSSLSKLVGDNEKIEEEKQKAREVLEQMSKDASDIPRETLEELLHELFPPIDEFYRLVEHGSTDREQWLLEKRICSSYYFDNYFNLSVPKFRITQREIDDTFSGATNPSKFLQELNKLDQHGHYWDFIGHLQIVNGSRITSDEIKNILLVSMNLDEVQGGPKVSRAILHLLEGISTFEERFEALSDAIDKCETSLYTMAWTIGDAYEWRNKNLPADNDSVHPNPKYVSIRPDHLLQLQEKASEKILAWARDGRLIGHPKLADILRLWRPWAGSNELSRCLDSLTDNHGDLIKFVSTFFEGAEEKGDLFVRGCVGNVQQFVDLKALQNRIERIRTSDKFENLDGPARLGIEAIIRSYSS
jgi:ABC-type branched-subunit amino acid transport system ATPase component